MHLVQVFFGEGLRMDLLRKNLRIVVSDQSPAGDVAGGHVVHGGDP